MKKNFMIAVNKDNAEAYKQTLLALGYSWTDETNYCYDFKVGVKNIYGYPTDQNYCWFSELKQNRGAKDFDNIEDFLIWYFTPEKTQTQTEIELEKLQLQIKELSEQAEKLKVSM